MPKPITELPLLEASPCEGIVTATAEGEIGEARELADVIEDLGYTVEWERARCASRTSTPAE